MKAVLLEPADIDVFKERMGCAVGLFRRRGAIKTDLNAVKGLPMGNRIG